MNFDICAVFKRSVTIELDNSTICYAPDEYSILINGEEKLRTNLNVVTVDGLNPGTRYTISIVDRDGCTEKSFVTECESVLLDVKAFGAVGDGKHDDTCFIQAAIDSCPAHGTVYVPKTTLKAMGWEEGNNIAIDIAPAPVEEKPKKAKAAKKTKKAVAEKTA